MLCDVFWELAQYANDRLHPLVTKFRAELMQARAGIYEARIQQARSAL